MDKIVNFKKEKEKIEEIDQLAEDIEKAMQVKPSPAHEFYEARDNRQLKKLIKEYGTDDYIKLCLSLSDKLLYETNEAVISDLIWHVFIVANKIADVYMVHYSEIDDPVEFFEYTNCDDKTRNSLIKWNYRIINRINDTKDVSPRLFNGLIYFYVFFIFDIIKFSNIK